MPPHLPVAITIAPAAPGSYRAISGSDLVRGGGPVPVASASLAVPGVAHGGAFGTRWYGTPEVVAQWWRE